jgi:hypothetical protein
LKELSDRLAEAGLAPATLLGIEESLPAAEQRERLQSLLTDLGRSIELTTGERVTVGDLVAIISYEKLQRARGKR